MKYVFIFFALLLYTVTCHSQDASTINLKIQEALTGKNLKLNDFIDKVDFYAFAFQLELKKQKGKAIIEEVKVNDSIAYQLYKDFDFLKQINYTSLLKKQKRATVIIPVGIIIAYTKNKTSTTIDIESLMPKIYNLFNISYPVPKNTINKYIFLNPVICTCGYKVYN